jgi:hypothetical protein
MFQSQKTKFPWRSAGALFFFLSALVGFSMGVAVTERPEVIDAGILTRAYYSLSLFVVGGVDLGTPYGGSFLGRLLVWTAYFGAPILAASTLIEALLKALAPQSWQLKRLKDHIIVVGSGNLSLAYLRVLRETHPRISVVVVTAELDPVRREELVEGFGATVVTGDITHKFFLSQLRVERARKIMLLGDNAMRSYEAASILINMIPAIGSRVVIHCGNLRFMRAMENTRVAKSCETFNTYHLAASGLVRGQLLHHFQETRLRDVVVMAGFGRFGQTILEEMQNSAKGELDTVAIIELDAHRRVLVADEQMAFAGDYKRLLYEGDIGHPEVWETLRNEVKIDGDNTVFVLGTGREEENLRTALWLRRRYPEALIIARCSMESNFASAVGQENNIISVSINALIKDNIPRHWID